MVQVIIFLLLEGNMDLGMEEAKYKQINWIQKGGGTSEERAKKRKGKEREGKRRKRK